MQIAVKQKKKAAEQAELEALEAENDVEAIELEIENVKRKGFIEEIFWRFPHIGEQIFEELDDGSLSKSLEINKWWQKIINERKIRQINQLEKHTYIKAKVLKKALGNKDFETVQKLANYSMKVFRKVILDGNSGRYVDFTSRKQQEKILLYLFEKKHRDNIQFLLTELMLKNTKKVTLEEIVPLIRKGEFEVIQMFYECLESHQHGNLMKVCKKVHLRWSNGGYSGESILEAVTALYSHIPGHPWHTSCIGF